jgi:hypothetical protein
MSRGLGVVSPAVFGAGSLNGCRIIRHAGAPALRLRCSAKSLSRDCQRGNSSSCCCGASPAVRLYSNPASTEQQRLQRDLFLDKIVTVVGEDAGGRAGRFVHSSAEGIVFEAHSPFMLRSIPEHTLRHSLSFMAATLTSKVLIKTESPLTS